MSDRFGERGDRVLFDRGDRLLVGKGDCSWLKGRSRFVLEGRSLWREGRLAFGGKRAIAFYLGK